MVHRQQNAMRAPAVRTDELTPKVAIGCALTGREGSAESLLRLHRIRLLAKHVRWVLTSEASSLVTETTAGSDWIG